MRAAAIIVVATGLNEVLAGAVPRYEPLVAYLVAIALVVLLDGVILGALAAVLAVGFHALLFLPRETLPHTLLVPVIGAILAIVLGAALRAVGRARRRAQPLAYYQASPPLLPSPPPPPPLDNTEVLGAIDELRDELRAAVTDLSSAREREELLERSFLEARGALVTRLRIAEEEGRAKEIELRRQLDAERGAFEAARSEALSHAEEEASLASRIAELQSSIAQQQRLVASLTSEGTQLRGTLEAERASASDLASSHERRIATLNDEAEKLRAALDAERTHALRLSAEIAAEKERFADLQTERARERANVETGRAEIEKLQRMLVTERAAVSVRAAEVDTTRTEMDTLRRDTATAQAEMATAQAEADALRKEVETARAESEALRKDAETVRAEADALRKEVDTTRAESEALRKDAETVRAEADALRKEVDTARAEAEVLRGEVDAERTESEMLRQRLDAARAAAREESERELTRLREQADGQVQTLKRAVEAERVTREQAEEQARALLAALQNEVETERASRGQVGLELSSLRERADHDSAELRGALEAERVARGEAERELASARSQAAVANDELETERGETIARAADLATLRRELELERAHAASERALRERVELDLGSARADIALLESRLEELDAMRATTERELRTALGNEKAASEKERAAFDAKLHTLVTHLAADHETDLGKAVLEREEARAEARSLNLKIGKLQQRVEEERQTILAKLREADERHRAALGDATRLLDETRAAAQKEIERLQLRTAELEQQQHAKHRAAAPLPPRGRVLIAHPDAEMRATARASLERAGYEVVGASDGLEALRTAIAQQPDVVVADMVMPKMNGRELCQMLKSKEQTAHIRVVLLARTDDELPKGDIPPDVVLRKPVPLERLDAALAKLMTRGVAGDRV